MKRITLMKIGARWCKPCLEIARRGTLEKFAAAHPDVKLVVHDDSEGGSTRWEDFATKWRVKNLPTLIWVAGGEELFRSEDVTLADIEKQYRRALKAIE